MAKSETLNLRVTSDFKRRLMEAAAEQKRSVTNYLEVTLMALWEAEKTASRGHKKRSPS